MNFNRNALLLYLRDLRDLEVAKRKIINLYNSEKRYVVKATKMEHNWAQRSAYLRNELNKVESLLTEYYNQNILPAPYRNLAALIYIYDYMLSLIHI